ncbi:sugar transferase [Sedimentibacter sp.]|uniref:sugar transferase n=1 Tax=Sedimentibacter sp. TaxID=1960295 RepID=UPI0028B1634E|nr:sugar transferase [Sedimentibacter sp.]
MYQQFFKRFIDVTASGIGLILLSPIFLIVIILIKIDSNGSALFTQKRVGKEGKEFKIFKFRTMLTFEDSFYPDGSRIENYDRITKVGNILRKTSIDELPQLINIFIGNMSIVGPRPTLSYQVEKYDDNQVIRLKAKPGLTGLAQVNGRNSLSWEQKIQYDIDYVDNITFLNDLKIILKTFVVVFKSEKIEFVAHDEISKHAGDVIDDVSKT